MILFFIYLIFFSGIVFVNAAAPSFGSDPADVLIWEEDFESYANTNEMIFAGGGPWDRDSRPSVTLDLTGGQVNSKAMKFARSTGSSGPRASRSGLTSPTHFFAEYYFKLVFLTAGTRSEVKWLIIHHNQEGAAGCSGGIARYQFELTSDVSLFGVSVPKPRFRQRGEFNTGCDGPVTGGTQTGYFTWGSNPQMPAPVLAEDPDISQVPWSPINDGNWHKHTIEIKVGDGTNGYTRLWLDGHLYWDSSASPMNLPGVPTSLLFETVSGGTTDAYDSWFDDMTLWKRSINVSDTTPPTRSSGSPSSNLSTGTTSTSISLTTNEAATCKYSTTAGTSYASMTNTFSTTGSISHSQLITGLSDGNTYNYYIRCTDSSNNFNTNDFTISFGVSMPGAPAVCGDSTCNGAETCLTCSQDCGICPSSGGLVASYNFNEGSGSSLTDRSGNGNNGSIIGATWTTGKYGNALDFNGVNDYVNILNSPSLDIASNEITLSAWVFLNELQTSDNGIIVKSSQGSGGNKYEYQLAVSTVSSFHNANFRTRTNSGLVSVGSLSDIPIGRWVHLAGVYNGTHNNVYFDGVLEKSYPQTGNILSNTEPLLIGRRDLGDTRFFKGVIDDVRIYNQALSQTEIQGDMNTPVSESNRLTFTYDWSHWYTNETTNLSLYTSNQLQDFSGVKFVNQFGTINFLENLNLSKLIYDLRDRIRVFSHKIWVNSSLIPEFNKSAQLTFRGVAYTNPIIKVDGADCPATICQNITFDEASGNYVFNVTAFSMFEIVEQCSDGIQNYDETGIDCGGSCGECSGGVTWVWVVGIAIVVGLVVWRRKRNN